MSAVFLKVVQMSLSASWMVLAVLVLRRCLRRAPKWVNVLLWGIVAVRLACPFSFESALSLMPRASVTVGPRPAIRTGVAALDRVIAPAVSSALTPAPGASADPLQIWIAVLAAVWLAGMAAIALYVAVSYGRLRYRVREAVRLRGNIYQSERVDAPFVLGVVRPRIYLPYHMDGRDQGHVIAHEQAHLRRGDQLWKPLGLLLLTVHWFNPLLWLAYGRLCRDIELACDEKVIKGLGGEQRADYSQALLSCSVNRRVIAACPLAFGEVGVKERVKSVLHYRKPAFWMIVLAVAVCVVTALCFLTNPKQDSFDITIVVPAGSQETFAFSEEEISPTRNQIIITAGENLGDTEVVLKPVEVKQENEYAPAYLTPGMPVHMKAEKGAWFKIGVNLQNATQGDRIVRVHVQNVEVRIASGAGTVQEWFDYTKDPSGMDWDRELTIEIPAFEATTFHYTPEQISVSGQSGESSVLMEGMPIWSAYFCDLTGDGYPEICASRSMGSGIIDESIIVYDYANGASYGLRDRGNCDYFLRMENGFLYVDQTAYNGGELVSSGRLGFRNDCLQVLLPETEGTTQRYFLTIGAEGVVELQVSAPGTSGGCVNADGTPFQAGERVWLACLEDLRDLRGVQITALDENGAVCWNLSIPEDAQNVNSASAGGWLLTAEAVEAAPVRSFVFRESKDSMKPSLVLLENGTFQFTFSVFSSYIGIGTYEIQDGSLTLQTDDGQFTYVFAMVDDVLVFDAERSSEQLWGSGLYDGAVME